MVQADETPLNVLKENKQCYMWLYCSGADSPEATLGDIKNIVLFDYQNSRAERAIKSLVIGRKNWLFANNPNGADASALLYSIIGTAKANGLILYDYMVKCMKELAKSEPDIDSLLPWNVSH